MPDDKDLLERISRGDKAAMEVLFERYQKPLFAFLRSRGADTQEADDAVQDAMLDVWRTAGRFSGSASVKTWVFTIGRNKLIDRMRKKEKVTLTDQIQEVIDEAPNAEAILISARDASRVRKCLSKLKPIHLSVIRLAFYDDLSYDEIGAIEDIPEGTVKSRVHHAKNLLLRCLGYR